MSLGAFEHFADGVGRFDRYDDFQDVLQHSARRWRDAAAFDRGARYRGGRAAGAEDDDDAASAKKILTRRRLVRWFGETYPVAIAEGRGVRTSRPRPTNILLDVESVVAALLNAAAAAHVLLNPVLTLGG